MTQAHRFDWWAISIGFWCMGVVLALVTLMLVGWRSEAALLLPLCIHSVGYLGPVLAVRWVPSSLEKQAAEDAEKGRWWVRGPVPSWPFWVALASLFLGIVLLVFLGNMTGVVVAFWIFGRVTVLTVWILLLGFREPKLRVLSFRGGDFGGHSMLLSGGERTQKAEVHGFNLGRGEVRIAVEGKTTPWLSIAPSRLLSRALESKRADRPAMPSRGGALVEATLHSPPGNVEGEGAYANGFVFGVGLLACVIGLVLFTTLNETPLLWLIGFVSLGMTPAAVLAVVHRMASKAAVASDGHLELGSTTVEWKGAGNEYLRWKANEIESIFAVQSSGGAAMVVTRMGERWSTVVLARDPSTSFDLARTRVARENVVLRLPMRKKLTLGALLSGAAAGLFVLILSSILALYYLVAGEFLPVWDLIFPWILALFAVLLGGSVVAVMRWARYQVGDFRVDEKGVQWGNRPVVPAAGVTLSAEGDGGISFDGLVKKGDGAKGLVLEGVLFTLGSSIQADLIAHALQAQKPRRIEEGTYRTVGRVVSESDAEEAEEDPLEDDNSVEKKAKHRGIHE